VYGTPGTTARKSVWSERQFKMDNGQGLSHLAIRRGVAPFALSAELLLFFLQPNERMRRDVTRVKAALGWASLPRPVLAMYMLGDVSQDRVGPFNTPEEYVRGAVAARVAYGFRSILLITDTPQTLVKLPSLLLDGGFEAVVSPSHPREEWQPLRESQACGLALTLDKARDSTCWR
jgi:hypothetical protein